MEVVIVFLFGLAVGSFLNVVIDRVPAGKSINGRSQCDGCGRVLKWFELIPVVSLLVQKRRSACCQTPLSYQYPLVEMACGVLFVLTYQRFGLTDLWLFPLLAGLLSLFVIDLKTMYLPDRIVFPLIALALVRLGISSLSNLGQLGYLWTLFGSLGIALFFLAIIFLTKGRGMGGGDVKLGFLLGLLVGWPSLMVALYLSFVIGDL